MDELSHQGFLVLKGRLSQEDISYARACFTKKTINYQNLKNVNENYLQKIGDHLGVKLTSMKFRASNNNNSVDAGAFHRDLHLKQNIELPRIYTCLLYLDDSTMQLIPGTHKQTHMSLNQALRRFKDKKNISVKAGDILVIYASIIHRGIFFKKQDNRRLIQQFDCLDVKSLSKLNNQILHVPCSHKCFHKISHTVVKINKIKPVSNFFNYLYYINVAQGYVRHVNLEKKLGYPEVIGFSSEVNQSRLKPKFEGFEEGNRYIVNYDVLDLPAKKLNKYRFYNQINTFLLILLLIVLIVAVVYIIIFVYQNFLRDNLQQVNMKKKKVKRGRKKK